MRSTLSATLSAMLAAPQNLARPLLRRPALGEVLAQPTATPSPSAASAPTAPSEGGPSERIGAAVRETLASSRRLLDRRLQRHGTLIVILVEPTAPAQADDTDAAPTSGEHAIIAVSRRWVRRSSARLRVFKQSTLDRFLEDHRLQHFKTISLEEQVISAEQKFARQQLKFHLILLTSMSVCWVVYTPLIALHLPFMLYLAIPMYKQAISDLRARKITGTVVDTCLSIGSFGYVVGNLPVLVAGEIAGVIFAYTQKLVAESKDTTRQRITNLFGQQPKRIWVLQDGVEVEVPFEAVQADDLVVIDAGQMIPVDGRIEQGDASIDQHMLTGEAQPAEKGPGDTVLAATVVLAGKIIIRVEKTGAATTAAQVGQILTDTSHYTASVQLRGREIAERSTVPTLLLSLVALPFVGGSESLAILLSGCGRTMRTLGPLSVMNFLRLTAQHGILIKDGRALEQVGGVTTVVFDKTGTLTQEQPQVGRIFSFDGSDEAQILRAAAAAEQRQSHPIARAIVAEAAARALDVPEISAAAYEIGYGIAVNLDGRRLRVGSYRFMAMEAISMPAEIEAIQHEIHADGRSLVYLAVDHQLAGAIELVPSVRPEAKRLVDYFRQHGLETVIISGDHARPTAALASALGVDRYFAETLPENKADLIEQLQRAGKIVCFVGDGINDSIALKKANVSVSLCGASTIATDTAQIILMDRTLNQLETVFELSKRFEHNMRGNLISSVAPGVIIIIGAFAGVVGYTSSLGIFALGMVAGVTNAMLPLFTERVPTRAEHAEQGGTHGDIRAA